MLNRYRLQPLIQAAILTAFVTPLPAQWLNHRTPGIPRNADGKPNLTAPTPRGSDGKPDFTGLWSGFIGTPDLGLADAQPWARTLVQQRVENFGKDNPRYSCLPEGPTAVDGASVMRRILQTPAMIAILYDDLTHRQIFMDGRALETDPNPSWMGYSVGRWDGDVLVVDSIGFNDRTWLARNYPHTEALRMTERYRRTDFGHLEIEARLEDPRAYSRPWTVWSSAQFAADTEMIDARCDPAESRREHWTGTISDSQKSAVKVPREVLAKYVGVYEGVWARRPRIIEISLSGDTLLVSVEGRDPQALVPQSETNFAGANLAYNFLRDDHGVASDVIEVHVSGDYKLQRRK
jgi:hypothetical protein